jgi:hypothetical protein
MPHDCTDRNSTPTVSCPVPKHPNESTRPPHTSQRSRPSVTRSSLNAISSFASSVSGSQPSLPDSPLRALRFSFETLPAVAQRRSPDSRQPRRASIVSPLPRSRRSCCVCSILRVHPRTFVDRLCSPAYRHNNADRRSLPAFAPSVSTAETPHAKPRSLSVLLPHQLSACQPTAFAPYEAMIESPG